MPEFNRIPFNRIIQTDITPEGIILQQVFDQHMKSLTSWIMNTRDHQIRQGLIELGWTPPPIDFTPNPHGHQHTASATRKES